FGLMDVEVKRKGSRKDYLWYITEGALFYLIASFKRDKLTQFVKNNSKLRILVPVGMVIFKKEWDEIDFLLHEIKKCVKEYRYKNIAKISYEWMRNLTGQVPVRFKLTDEMSSTHWLDKI